jgi:hypothetical protein
MIIMKKNFIFTLLLVLLVLASCQISPTNKLWLDEMDLSYMKIESGENLKNAISDTIPLSISDNAYKRGVATVATSTFLVGLDGKGVRFHSEVGIDRATRRNMAVIFMVFGDGKLLWTSDTMKNGDGPKIIDIDISKISRLGLLAKNESQGQGGFPMMMPDAGGPGGGMPGGMPSGMPGGMLPGAGGPPDMGVGPGGAPGGAPAGFPGGGFFGRRSYVDWANAYIEYKGKIMPVPVSNKVKNEAYILTPETPKTPKINGVKVIGATPDKEFLYAVPITGERPINVTAENLPAGLAINSETGFITGTTPKEKGECKVTIKVSNSLGEARGELKIVIGNKLALTPPLGWNSWNVWGKAVDQDKVKAAADAMAEKLRDHGWAYINIDDGWEAKERTTKGELLANDKFPGMEKLGDYIHSKGLKFGIYSTPGPKTCGQERGSYSYEYQDAKTWARWGVDYLKYDWCSYGQISKGNSLEELQKPYRLMKDALVKSGRDVVYSLCQYGMGDVWKWGDEVGGDLWRTSGDIQDTWESLKNTGFSQVEKGNAPYAGPSHWNDPDMLVVGQVGWGPTLKPSRLTPDEQYTHISLWSIMAAPLLIGCDMANMDDFTLSLLTNDEVLAVNQDPLGVQGVPVVKGDDYQIWSKDMQDGSKAVAVFYLGKDKVEPSELFNWDDKGPQPKTISIDLEKIGQKGEQQVRDLWRQQDMGVHSGSLDVKVNYHGVVLIKITPQT